MGGIADGLVEIFGSSVMLAVPAYFALQAWLGYRLRGAWRLAALIPLLFAVPVFIWCMTALADDSNLWPLPFIFFAPLAVAYLLIVLVLNRMFAAEHASTPAN